jgi:hypothetical protein
MKKIIVNFPNSNPNLFTFNLNEEFLREWEDDLKKLENFTPEEKDGIRYINLHKKPDTHVAALLYQANKASY